MGNYSLANPIRKISDTGEGQKWMVWAV